MSLIVILDDRVTNRKIFSRLAASIAEDITVNAFGDPGTALEWLEQNTPDLIVTDFKMPRMDGAEFIRRFREQSGSSEVPVIVITVYEERSFRMRALEAGATDFLQSPVDHREFVTRARNLLQLRKQQLLLANYAQKLEQKLAHSERSRREAIRDSREQLAQVIDTIPAMISATDQDGRFLFVNAYQSGLLGAGSELVGETVDVVFGPEHGARNRALDRKIFESGAPLPSFEEEIVNCTGVKRVFLTSKAPLRDSSNAVVGVLTSALEITDRKRAEAHLLYMAQHDALTDLPNRTLLRDRLRRAIGRARRGESAFALHLIDLDGFKNVNDLLGHSVGDKYLKAIAERLRSIMRETDTVARLGGDEFAILQTHVTGSEDAAELATRVIKSVAEPCLCAGERLTLSASVGITIHPTDGIDAIELFKNADLAMYRAKADGGNLYRFYAADMNARAREAASLDSALREAIEKEQFALFFQPQVETATGRIVGAEALLRWDRPGCGIIDPGDFLSRAEHNGLILPINEWVLREACLEAKAWRHDGLPLLRIAVNLSPIQFRKQNVPLLVAKVLADTGLEPWRLDLELTESIMLQKTEEVAKDLRKLKELGVSISIDDFGTGYSSFSYVKRFPVDRLKIDQCFVRDATANPHDAAIVRAMINLGQSLDLQVVAEGVETAEQLALLRSEGCDEVQGYYFSIPLPAAQFVALARKSMPLALIA